MRAAALTYSERLDAFGPRRVRMDIARGDSFFDLYDAPAMPSPLAGVSDDEWKSFVSVMATQRCDTVTPLNCIGMFEMTPRRLADIGWLGQRLRRGQLAGKTVWMGAWADERMSDAVFLGSPWLQLRAFVESMEQYDAAMTSGEIVRDPSMSRAGALAVLHRAGPRGLDNWKKVKRPETVKLYERAAGCF